ncbi:MAG: oxidoreductase [Rhodospirillaceae bacterium]|nr:oxidoreductase [Rhodospirillaceae bacterium]
MRSTVTLAGGEVVPAMGLGTWHMGERIGDPNAEAIALQRGIDLGATLIDTAEMYARGGAERVVAKAVKGRRDEVFIVSKVVPHNASRTGTIRACENSLSRLNIETIDLYLLHWPGPHPIRDTVAAFEELKKTGKIKYWGVSNFNTDDMNDLWKVPGGTECQTNQILYNLMRRGVEWDLLPWCSEHGVSVMAYSPLEQGRLLSNKRLRELSKQTGLSPSQLAIAWTLRKKDIISIPKASSLAHVEENVDAWDKILTQDIQLELDKEFHPPEKKGTLDIL